VALKGGLAVKKIILAVLGLGIVFFGLAAALVPSAPPGPEENAKAAAAPQAAGVFVVRGQTQCVPGRKGILAPAVLHPVTDVLVSVGDTVKKGQPLVQLDDDEPQADVRVKKAIHENADIARVEAKRYLANLEKLQAQGAIPEQRIHDARATALKTEADVRAAKAAIDVAMAELEHYVVSAPIDGVVNRLEVHPGMVSRPGTSIWGEVLDIKDMDVRCQLMVGQTDNVKIGDPVEVLGADSAAFLGTGRLVFVGLVATADNGMFPALVRLTNPNGKLRCGVAVQLRFNQARKNP
jgi:RND family efflux transporter MFP subunit